MDSFVLCVAKKSAVAKIQKDMAEVALFCPDRKSGDRFGLPSSFTVMSETGESVFALLDTKVCIIAYLSYSEMVKRRKVTKSVLGFSCHRKVRSGS